MTDALTFRSYATIRALRNGEKVNLDGMDLIMDGDGTIKDGDLYAAERNTVQLLTAARVDADGYIVPTTTAYCFDTDECVKVKAVD